MPPSPLHPPRFPPTPSRQDDAPQEEEDESDEEEAIYNPLKLPMGWDGKPIPYWLYKLHGLNQVQCCGSGSSPATACFHCNLHSTDQVEGRASEGCSVQRVVSLPCRCTS